MVDEVERNLVNELMQHLNIARQSCIANSVHGSVGSQCSIFPQIALAIGVLTSNRRGGDCTHWRIGRGAIAGCHSWVPFDRVPLLGAIAGCNRRGVVT